MGAFAAILLGTIGGILLCAGAIMLHDSGKYVLKLASWCFGFALAWSIPAILSLVYPVALLAVAIVGLSTFVIPRYLNRRDEPDYGDGADEQKYYDLLKRQDAAQAVADWDARAEELLIEAGVACICPTTPVVTHLTWEDRRITKTKRHPVIYCPVHAWRGLELAKSPENLVG